MSLSVLSDESLHAALARPCTPAERASIMRELRRRVRTKILNKMPARTGTCPHGKRILWDDRGAYSSGYPIHIAPDGIAESGYCDLHEGIVDDPSEERQRLRALLDSI